MLFAAQICLESEIHFCYEEDDKCNEQEFKAFQLINLRDLCHVY